MSLSKTTSDLKVLFEEVDQAKVVRFEDRFRKLVDRRNYFIGQINQINELLKKHVIALEKLNKEIKDYKNSLNK